MERDSAVQTFKTHPAPKALTGLAVLGLAVLGAAVWALAPGLAARAGPLLVLAACPLSMALMMLAMRGGRGSPAEPGRDCPDEPPAGPRAFGTE